MFIVLLTSPKSIRNLNWLQSLFAHGLLRQWKATRNRISYRYIVGWVNNWNFVNKMLNWLNLIDDFIESSKRLTYNLNTCVVIVVIEVTMAWSSIRGKSDWALTTWNCRHETINEVFWDRKGQPKCSETREDRRGILRQERTADEFSEWVNAFGIEHDAVMLLITGQPNESHTASTETNGFEKGVIAC